MSLLGNFRDKAIEALIRKNETVKRFGEIQSVSINSDEGYADVSILLHGEPAPITFRGYYVFHDMGDTTDVVVTSITCKRAWIDEALSLVLEKTTLRYTLPRLAGGLAKILF